MPTLYKIAAIIGGSCLIAIGINLFLMPFKVLDGGLIGIGLIINYLFGAKVGLVIMISSVPIFLLAWFTYRDILYNSLIGLVISSICIDLLVPLQNHFIDYIALKPLSSAIIGGFIIGTGIGIMLRYETSTGGTDLLAQYLSKVMSLNVGILIFIIDGIIICLGGLLVSAETFVLSILTITAGGLATSVCTIK